MPKFIFDDHYNKFDIEDSLTIAKGTWSDGNPRNEDRLNLFVTSGNDNNEVNIAKADSYICGVTIRNDVFLDSDNNAQHCVVQSMGVCIVRDDGSLVAGDKCMPSDTGTAIKSNNELGYRVVGRSDSTHVKIIMSPNNDMVQRIKNDLPVTTKSVVLTLTNGIENPSKTVAISILGELNKALSVELTIPTDVTKDELKALGKTGLVLSSVSTSGGSNTLTFKTVNKAPDSDIRVKVVATYQGV